MPNRILKESICTSDEIDRLTEAEEVFFYRLMVVCDDFGCMDARPAIIKARCYPLKSITIKSIQALLTGLEAVGLIETYTVGGKPYLHVSKWEQHQQIRAKRAKYPLPKEADASNGNQLQADDSKCHRNPIQSKSIQSESNPQIDAQKTALDFFEEAWKIYPQREGANKKQTLKAWEARIKAKVSPEVMIEGAKRYARYCLESGTESKYIKLPSVFFGTDEHFRSNWTVTTKSKLSSVVPAIQRTCTHCKEPAHMEISGRWYCRNHDQYSTSEAA